MAKRASRRTLCTLASGLRLMLELPKIIVPLKYPIHLRGIGACLLVYLKGRLIWKMSLKLNVLPGATKCCKVLCPQRACDLFRRPGWQSGPGDACHTFPCCMAMPCSEHLSTGVPRQCCCVLSATLTHLTNYGHRYTNRNVVCILQRDTPYLEHARRP